MPVIQVNKLTKVFRTAIRREGVSGALRDLFHRNYRDVTAVDNISLAIEPGELVGYIGPNGAGKSTSIKILTGILQPTSGEVSVIGLNPFKERKRYTKSIGVVFGQRSQLWWDIPAIESFRLLGHVYEVEGKTFEARLGELTELLAVREILHTPVRKLSLGERMRCELLASLLHRPQVLFLDEPTIGLDAVAKSRVREFLRHINTELKTTILLTTHDLREIEELSSRILIIDHGRILFDGDIKRIKSLPGLERTIVCEFVTPPREADLAELVGVNVQWQQESDRRYTFRFIQERIAAADLVKSLLNRYELADVAIHEPDIEEVVRKIYNDGEIVGARAY